MIGYCLTASQSRQLRSIDADYGQLLMPKSAPLAADAATTSDAKLIVYGDTERHRYTKTPY